LKGAGKKAQLLEILWQKKLGGRKGFGIGKALFTQSVFWGKDI